MAYAKPSGHGEAALQPSEDPGDGAKIFEAASFSAACGTRSDAGGVEFVHWRRLLEVFENIWIVGDLLAIDIESCLRHLFDRVFPRRRMIGRARPQQRLDTGRHH